MKGTKRASARAAKAVCLGSTAFAALCLPAVASAQTANDNSAAQANTDVVPQAADGGIDEIVVTARRDAENAQHVPVSIQVVTGEGLRKLAITSVEEVSKLAPGLTLVNNGSNTQVTLRGVTFQPGSGTPATPIYFNEIPFDPQQTIVSLFDVGQIEVLRGPQGTTRGAPSISGAVTISTRKPDLSEFGGSFLGLYGEGRHRSAQIGINIPIIKEILAIRLAANIENSRGNRVYSVNSDIDPKFKDRSYRATVLFQPTDTLSVQAMYQRRKTFTREYTQVAGPGSPGFPGTATAPLLPALPAGFNGPALSVKDRNSVQDLPSDNRQHVDLVTINASWEVLGHTLSYNYGRQIVRTGTVFNATDVLNIVPGFESFTTVTNVNLPKFNTNEIRISSLPSENRPFDYDLGWFSKYSNGLLNFGSPTYLSGAFGNPATASPGNAAFSPVPNPRYVLNSSTDIRIGQQFDSFYGNIRFHLDRNTELTGGLAILRDRVPVDLDITTFAAANAVALPFPGAFGPAICPRIGGVPSPVYTGTPLVCDILLPAGIANSSQRNNNEYSKAIYNFSLSHRFNEDLLAYATTGSSFRSGLPAINNNGLPADLTTPDPETAKSYEVGIKSSFGRRFRLNVSAFQLDYKGQLTTFEGVRYFNSITQSIAQTSLAFYRNVDARVRGLEVEVATKPFDHLSLGGNISYSKIKSQGGLVPGNTATPLTAANPINFVESPKGQVLNQQPPLQVTLNGDLDIPVTDAISGYVRFNANFRGKNPNFGNFGNGSDFRKTKAYEIIDLFAGVSGGEGSWDLGVYAKNVFDTDKELNRLAVVNTIYRQFAAASGYDQVRTTRPREIGVTLRYAFGSR